MTPGQFCRVHNDIKDSQCVDWLGCHQRYAAVFAMCTHKFKHILGYEYHSHVTYDESYHVD